MTNPQPLADLLDTLSRAHTLLEPTDRDAAARLGRALRERWRGSGPVRVLLVTGPDADPVGEWLEDIVQALARTRDELTQTDDHVQALLTEMRQRRARMAGERQRLQDQVRLLEDRLRVVAGNLAQEAALVLRADPADRLNVAARLTELAGVVTPDQAGASDDV